MATKERILPSLLDRLTDERPSETRPEADRFSFPLERYREAVYRDLDWLLNAVTPLAADDVEDYPAVKDSVLNYGMPPLSGRAGSGLDARGLERAIREVVTRFEPRILPKTVKVAVEVSGDRMSRHALTFRVEGQLWAEPVPEQIYLRTQLDLETGHVTVSDLGRRGR